MTWARVVTVLSFSAMFVFGTNSADASVQGSKFAGGFVTNLGFPAVCTLSFDPNGTLTQYENGILFGGTYTGDYTEVEIGGITYWRSVVADESPNGYATFSGFCLFGVITSFHNQNLDQGITADGWLIRTGSTARMSARP